MQKHKLSKYIKRIYPSQHHGLEVLCSFDHQYSPMTRFSDPAATFSALFWYATEELRAEESLLALYHQDSYIKWQKTQQKNYCVVADIHFIIM